MRFGARAEACREYRAAHREHLRPCHRQRADLAVPLTRRALARRSVEDAMIVEPLPYRESGRGPEMPLAAVPRTHGGRRRSSDGRAATDIAPVAAPAPWLAEATRHDPSPTARGPLDLVAGAPAPAVPRARRGEDAPDRLRAAAAAATSRRRRRRTRRSFAAASGSRRRSSSPPELLPPAERRHRQGRRLQAQRQGPFRPGFCITRGGVQGAAAPMDRPDGEESSRPGPLWAVMHDDEDMSFDSAVAGAEGLRRHAGGRRHRRQAQPVRHRPEPQLLRRRHRLQQARRPTPRRATPAFFHASSTAEPIIALHNNSDGTYPDRRPRPCVDGERAEGHAGGARRRSERPARRRPQRWCCSPRPTPVTRRWRAAPERSPAKGINAMIERVAKKGDCSLSNYALLTGHPDYLNVTVDDDEGDKQTQDHRRPDERARTRRSRRSSAQRIASIASFALDLAQRLMPPSSAYRSISFSSFLAEARVLQRAGDLGDLLRPAGADQRGGHALVAQHPGDRHLRQRLAAPLGDVVQRA